MKIIVHTLFTESHRNFFEKYFLPSFPFNENIELKVFFKKQLCKSSEFMSEGWNETMRYKAECFYTQIKKIDEQNEIFMFIDPDVQFFGDFYNDIIAELNDHDVVFQNDYGGGANTGFFAAKNNKVTRRLFLNVLQNLHNFPEEQRTLNHMLRDFNDVFQVKWKFLPKRYWTYGEIAIQPNGFGGVRDNWDGSDFEIPKDIIIHHGNWTKCFEDKFKILDKVKNKVNGN
jgi:hypothetical protein